MASTTGSSRPDGGSWKERLSEAARSTKNIVGDSLHRGKAHVDGIFNRQDAVPSVPDLSEDDRVALCGALFAIASADGLIETEEMAAIFELIDVDGLSHDARRRAHGFLVDPPSLPQMLKDLAKTNETIRYGILSSLIAVAMGDDTISSQERAALDEAQRQLKIPADKGEALIEFHRRVRAARELKGALRNEAIKNAMSFLAAAGVPLTAVYFCGVVGFSAVGITSGLAAIGLGLGMVPGIGVALLIGLAVYKGTSGFLDIGGRRAQAKRASERERKAQLVIRNLQTAINSLAERAKQLSAPASAAEANKEAILKVNERIAALKTLLARRRALIPAS